MGYLQYGEPHRITAYSGLHGGAESYETEYYEMRRPLFGGRDALDICTRMGIQIELIGDGGEIYFCKRVCQWTRLRKDLVRADRQQDAAHDAVRRIAASYAMNDLVDDIVPIEPLPIIMSAEQY